MAILMVVIILMKNLFIKDIEKIAISNNNIESFNRHVLGEGKYSFSLPSGWGIDIYNNIKGNIIRSKTIEDIYKWKFITESDEKVISNYYIRDYSEGKVLIIKFSYNEGKEKKSIKIVFDHIAMSFN